MVHRRVHVNMSTITQTLKTMTAPPCSDRLVYCAAGGGTAGDPECVQRGPCVLPVQRQPQHKS